VHEYASREFTFRVTVGAIYHFSSTPIPGKFIRFLFFQSKKNKKSRFAHGRRPGADRRTGNVDFYGRFNFVYATLKKTVLVFLYGIV
jgi:hypothetical protein